MPEARSERPSLLSETVTLTRTELRLAYQAEWNSWKSIKERCRDGKGVLAPEFRDFVEFLLSVGRCPVPGHTVDRIDPNNPRYGPGLVRWLSKEGQANNRKETIWLERDGKRLPLSQWAKLTKQKADTMRRRRREGWTDFELIEGRKDAYNPKRFGVNPHDYVPWPEIFPDNPEVHADWECDYLRDGHGDRNRIEYALRVVTELFEEKKAELAAFDAGGPGYDETYRNEVYATALSMGQVGKRADALAKLHRVEARKFDPRYKSNVDQELIDFAMDY